MPCSRTTDFRRIWSSLVLLIKSIINQCAFSKVGIKSPSKEKRKTIASSIYLKAKLKTTILLSWESKFEYSLPSVSDAPMFLFQFINNLGWNVYLTSASETVLSKISTKRKRPEDDFYRYYIKSGMVSWLISNEHKVNPTRKHVFQYSSFFKRSVSFLKFFRKTVAMYNTSELLFEDTIYHRSHLLWERLFSFLFIIFTAAKLCIIYRYSQE